jgi:hypothetical protein
MATTYTWEITKIERKLKMFTETDNFMCLVSWKKIGTDENGISGEFSTDMLIPGTWGTSALNHPVLFNSEADLTNEKFLTLIEYICETGQYDSNSVNKEIQDQINSQK